MLMEKVVFVEVEEILKSLANCHDLTNLPLVSILSRKQTSLVFLVRLGSTDSVVKLFCTANEAAALSSTNLVQQFRACGSSTSAAPAFLRELICLCAAGQANESDLKQNGVVKIAGWGIAENYRGVVLEALKGPTFQEYLGATSTRTPHVGSIPPYLQLLYRLHWAYQVCAIVADLHRKTIIHCDLKAENFAFRVPPSDLSFGDLAVFDFDNARLMKRHNQDRDRLAVSCPDPLRAARDEFIGSVTAGPGVDEQAAVLSRAEEESGPCGHWPVEPPPGGGGFQSAYGSSRAPELFSPDLSCAVSAAYKREAERRHEGQEKLRIKGKGTLAVDPCDGSCEDPECVCSLGRSDVWSLGMLLARLFKISSSSCSTCVSCGELTGLNEDAVDMWCDAVTGLIDYNLVGFGDGLPGGAFTIPWSLQRYTHVCDHNARSQWGELAFEIKSTLGILIKHSALSFDPRDRCTALYLAHSFRRLFLETFRLLAHTFPLLPLPAEESRLTDNKLKPRDNTAENDQLSTTASSNE